MNSTDQERQDQRTITSMEDSPALTIEFLRARLLSERSVSKSARQRADELAKRVAELEEQLKVVSFQRMKAEKAAEDVLAILNSNGISDISETCDSSSDQDTRCESNVGNKSSKEEENSVNSRVQRSDSEELSGSDLDFSSISGRSLSWKGHKHSPRSLEKFKDPSLRRRSSFASAGSSPKNRLGKSCRQIRCKDSKSVAEEFIANSIKVDSSENGVVNECKVFTNCSDFEGVIENGEEKPSTEGSLPGYFENQQNLTGNEHDYNLYGGDRDMETALEHQAQLIGRYEEMEKAQREWEEKFRENNDITPDSCDPGNRSDVTEERFEIKTQAPDPEGIVSQTHGAKSKAEDLSKIQPNGIPPHSQTGMVFLPEGKSSSTPASKSPAQDFAFPVAMEKQNQEGIRNNYHPTSHSSYHQPNSRDSRDIPGIQSASSIPSKAGSTFSKGKASGSQNEQYALVLPKGPKELGGVLEALKQAKQSLQQKMIRLPMVEGGSVTKPAEPSIATTETEDRVEIPGGSVGLFRLPTGIFVEGNTRTNSLNSGTRVSSGNYYPDTRVSVAESNHLITRPYFNARSSFSSVDQFVTGPHVEVGSGLSPRKHYFDPHLDVGLPSSSRQMYPTYPIRTSYADPMPMTPTREGFPTFIPRRSAGLNPGDRFSFASDHIGTKMYR